MPPRANHTLFLFKSCTKPYNVSWSPPPSGYIKWNVDASYDHSLPHAAVRGVLRSSEGHFMCVFSSPIPLMEINVAEVFTMFRALKITRSCEGIDKSKFIIESGSANAVRWCNADSGGPWNINFPLNIIRNCKLSTPIYQLFIKAENPIWWQMHWLNKV